MRRRPHKGRTTFSSPIRMVKPFLPCADGRCSLAESMEASRGRDRRDRESNDVKRSAVPHRLASASCILHHPVSTSRRAMREGHLSTFSPSHLSTLVPPLHRGATRLGVRVIRLAFALAARRPTVA